MIVAATDALFLLAVLACPVGMLLMMWFMGRGMMGRHRASAQPDALPELKAEQARLAEKIEALEAKRTTQSRRRPAEETSEPTAE